jgi:GNAT superfamily N-acetyltransferase
LSHEADVAQDRAVETLALAFFDDPLLGWIFENPTRRADNLRSWWRWIIENAPGHAELRATDDDLSAAIWYGPDPDDSAGHTDFPAMLIGLIGVEAARRKLAGLAVIPAARPTVRHWYLGAVGTRPNAQRRGSAVRVVRPVLDQCDAAGVLAYLESSNPRNVTFYERLGFVAVEAISLPGGPTLTGMQREPRRR